jgi:hypothetical protein
MKTGNVTSSDEEIDAGEAASEFRATLDFRREAEDIMANALEAQHHAAASASGTIHHSEALARQIEEDARASARAATTSAQERAEQIVTDALKEAAHISEKAESGARAWRREEAEARAVVEATRARADAEAAEARLETEQLREAARTEVAAERSAGRAALDEQSSCTISHLETMTREVQATLDRARGEVANTLSFLADHQLLTTRAAEAPVDVKAERRRRPFRAVH